MEIDFSRVFYEKYFKGKDRVIEVCLKNGRKITGAFVAFFVGECDRREPFITKWHIVDEKYKKNFGIDEFGFPTGEIIDQNDIESVKFLNDNSIFRFRELKEAKDAYHRSTTEKLIWPVSFKIYNFIKKIIMTKASFQSNSGNTNTNPGKQDASSTKLFAKSGYPKTILEKIKFFLNIFINFFG